MQIASESTRREKLNPLSAPAFYSFIRNETPLVLLLENPMITGLSNLPSLSQSAILKQKGQSSHLIAWVGV